MVPGPVSTLTVRLKSWPTATVVGGGVVTTSVIVCWVTETPLDWKSWGSTAVPAAPAAPGAPFAPVAAWWACDPL